MSNRDLEKHVVAELESALATLLQEHARLRAWVELQIGPVPEPHSGPSGRHRGGPRNGSAEGGGGRAAVTTIDEARALVAKIAATWSEGDVVLLARLAALGPPSELLEECRGGNATWAQTSALAAYRAVDHGGKVLGAPHTSESAPPPPHSPVELWPHAV